MRRALPALAPAFAIAAAAVLALAGCGGSTPTDGASGQVQAGGSATSSSAPSPHHALKVTGCDGVFVTVQFGLLGAHDLNTCAKTREPITAAAALKAAGVTTEGTKQYGDQVVCRVNGEPSATKPFTVPGKAPYTEKCQGMPAAFAYWAVWVRSGTGKWDYASSGITTQQVEPGEVLGLKFTTGSDTTPPQD